MLRRLRLLMEMMFFSATGLQCQNAKQPCSFRYQGGMCESGGHLVASNDFHLLATAYPSKLVVCVRSGSVLGFLPEQEKFSLKVAQVLLSIFC
jgi:hypothetical protein